MSQVFYYGDQLTPSIAMKMAKGEIKGRLNQSTINKINKSSQIVTNIVAKGDPVYGINTGFGPLCTTKISKEETNKLQENLLKSHAVGVGTHLDSLLVRLMMILKIQGLSQGYSGVCLSTIERIIWMLDNDVLPAVPSQGSVGASGDLAPLSHLFLPLIGEGHVYHSGRYCTAASVYERFGLSPISLSAKEGLGLINGTQFIAAHAVFALSKMKNLLDTADICGALMIEGLKGSASPFLPELHATRPHSGLLYTASKVHHLLAGSQIVASHVGCDKVQDPYSLRCIPQVHGASRNAWLHVYDLTSIEINSVTDNPVIIDSEHSISGGNFHGQPLAMALDYLALAAAEIGNISDRRSYLALEGKTDGVPKLLMHNLGTNSGFMIPQYTAAALVSENKSLCFPASADSIPTSLGQEDHVSMGSISGRKAVQIIENVEKILGIELLSACQAYDFHAPLQSGKVLHQLYAFVRTHISHITEDLVFYPIIEKAITLVTSGAIADKCYEFPEYNTYQIEGRKQFEI